MRMLKTIVPALLALVLLAGATTSIAAQSDTPTQFEDIEGLEKAYARTFTADMMAMFNMATPGAMPSGWFALTTMVLQFDNEDHAEAGLQTLLDEIALSGLTGGDGQMEDVELDIDMDHVAMQDVVEADGMATTVLVAAAQDDEFVYAVVGVTFGEDPVPAVEATLTAIEEAEVSDDEETLNEDGTSEGGLWAKFPSVEDVQAEAPALITALDETLYPVSSSSVPVRTPATVSTPAG